MFRAKPLAPLALLTWLGCQPAAAPEKTAPATASAPASASAPARPEKAPQSPLKKGEKVPLTAEEKEALAEYKKAMKEGREATRAKDYPRAIAAFDRAVAARPDNKARAVSERGYARLLAGDLAAAAQDLDEASGLTQDKKLLAQIWYNRGLIAEKQGDSDAALRAFTTSNGLNPTKAAAKKIEQQKPVCPVEIDRAVTEGKAFPNWLALARELGLSPASEAEAKKALCGEASCQGGGPWIANTGGEELYNAPAQTLVFPRPDGSLLAHPELGMGQIFARCGIDGSTIELLPGEPIRVRRTISTPGYPEYVYVDEKGEVKSCDDLSEAEFEKVSGDCHTACFEEGEEEREELFFDAQGRLVLTIKGLDEITSLSLEADGIRLKGAGCDEKLPLPAKKP